MPTPALAIVADPETGEVVDTTLESLSDEVLGQRDIIKGLERDIRGWTKRYAELQRDKDGEARAHEAWPLLAELFRYWRELTGHSRAKWTPDRFWTGWPMLKTFGVGNFAAGIAGIAYDPNKREQKNGKWEVYDSWELLCRDSGTMERYIKRRPVAWALPENLRDLMERSTEEQEYVQREIVAVA